MLSAQLEDRFLAALTTNQLPADKEAVRFAVEFARLLARILPDEVEQVLALSTVMESARTRIRFPYLQIVRNNKLPKHVLVNHLYSGGSEPGRMPEFSAHHLIKEPNAVHVAFGHALHLQCCG